MVKAKPKTTDKALIITRAGNPHAAPSGRRMFKAGAWEKNRGMKR